MLDRYVLRQISTVQREEVTVGEIYMRIAPAIDDLHIREMLREIAREELEHYSFWTKYTASDIAPDRMKVFVFSLLLRVLGFTFTLKLLASRHALDVNKEVLAAIPEAETILRKDEAHKKQIVTVTDLLDEERFHYVGAIVLGLNDAIVEFTGMLAGLTFALQESKLIAITGIVAGISASLSMAASEYLSQRSEEGPDKRLKPLKAAMYTGISYLTTVALLILPFITIQSPYIALPFSLAAALVVIFMFTFYHSVALGFDFRKRFAEMVLISMGIALLSFIIGLGMRLVLHVTV
jgi:VIT1/CCC1 family predicted Fe2+/Mn2+ transporter